MSVARPGEFLNVPEVGRLVKKLIRELIQPSLRQVILRKPLGASRVRSQGSPLARP